MLVFLGGLWLVGTWLGTRSLARQEAEERAHPELTARRVWAREQAARAAAEAAYYDTLTNGRLYNADE
jgi:hypothetical protein